CRPSRARNLECGAFGLSGPMDSGSHSAARKFCTRACVRWYAAYQLSLRNLEEMMAERGVLVDHATVHRWSLKMLPVLARVFRRRKHPVGRSWRVDETYVLVGGQWKYLYRAVDRPGQTVDFLLTARRDAAAASRVLDL